MKKAELNSILEYNGELVKVTGIATGKMIIMEPLLDSEPCQKCGEKRTIYALEDSPNFQLGAKPIQTIKES